MSKSERADKSNLNNAVSRRDVLLGAATFATTSAIALGDHVRVAQAQDKIWRHGTSLFGNLKYALGFKQFDYVNANARR
jgi:microcin C transport system substrate-binding protein